jgi:hypothetical protein
MARKKSRREISNQAFRIMSASQGNEARVNRARSIGMRYLKNIDNKRKSDSVTKGYVRNTYMGKTKHTQSANGIIAG